MAAPNPAPPRIVQFGGFELDLARAELRKGGAVESLPPQPLRVLVLLASRAGDLVTRETIRQELWGEDVSVDFDHGLNTCIRQIRAVLGDEARSWRFIETVHRRGYRFHLPAAPPAKRLRWMHWKLAAGLALAVAGLTIAGYGTVSTRHSARLAQAHDLVVEGRLYSSRLTADAQRSAISSFEKALALDPRSAPAHAGLALAYIGLSFDGGMRRQDASPKAAEAARTAIALDTQSAEAHTAMAEVKYRIEQDRRQAEAEFRRALALDPASVDGHWRFGRFLYTRGRFADGEAEIRKALTLDPLSVPANFQLECVQYYRRDYHAAIAQGRRTLELDQRYGWAHHVLGLALEAEHEYDEAVAEFEKSQRGPSGNLGHAYAVAGRRAEALKILDQLKSRYEREGVGPDSVAQVYIGLGEFDRALEWLNTAVAGGSEFLTLGVAPLYDPLRSDLRFKELLRRSGLID